MHAGEPSTDGGTLHSVMALYGISEQQAVARLAREAEAAETWMRVRSAGLQGYAGAWFNGETLLVGTNRSEEQSTIQALGATPVPVAFSLTQLQARREAAVARVGANSIDGTSWSSYGFVCPDGSGLDP